MEVFFVERLVLMFFQEKVGLLNVFLSMTYRASRNINLLEGKVQK